MSESSDQVGTVCLNSERFEIPLEKLPVTVKMLSGERIYLFLGIFVGFLVTGMGAHSLVTRNEEFPALTWWCALVPGIAVLFWAVVGLGRTKLVTISTDSIQVYVGLFGRVKSWRADLSDYLGISIETGQVSHGQYSNPTVHTVVLQHSESRYSIPLFQCRAQAEAEDHAREVAASLGVPILADQTKTEQSSPVR